MSFGALSSRCSPIEQRRNRTDRSAPSSSSENGKPRVPRITSSRNCKRKRRCSVRSTVVKKVEEDSRRGVLIPRELPFPTLVFFFPQRSSFRSSLLTLSDFILVSKVAKLCQYLLFSEFILAFFLYTVQLCDLRVSV